MKGGEQMKSDKLIAAIERAGLVVEALIQLGLKIGTLVGVIKMILDAIN